MHPEQVIVGVQIIPLEPPDDLPEDGQLLDDRRQARGASAPDHPHALVHLSRGLLDTWYSQIAHSSVRTELPR